MTTQRIFLTGYMGAGKTMLGRAFAAAQGLQFVDLDWYIEERMHRTVSQLFAEEGEEGFRRTEQRLLHEVACFDNVVVATGGGTPCSFDNMEVMNRAGITVFLDVPVPVLLARLKVARSGRPLLAGMNDDELYRFVTQALAQRRPYYERSFLRLDASMLDDAPSIGRTVQELERLLRGDSFH